jgi:Tol biopolymer transport system component
MGTDGSAPVRIEHPANDAKPQFTPDGSGVVFHSDRQGGNLWFQPLAGGRPAGEPRLVWQDTGPFGVAESFAGTGSLIYFFRSNGYEIFTADIDLSRGLVAAPARVTPVRGEMMNAPAFSPDGQFLAHMRDQARRLVVRDVASGVEREFHIGAPLLVPSLDFCPDGRSVLVSGSDAGGRATYRVNLERGGAERVPVSATHAVCVADGREIVYLRSTSQGAGEVVRRSLTAGTETRLHDGPANVIGLARSPDGSKIAFVVTGNDDARLVVMPSSGGEAVTVATSPRVPISGGRMWHEFHGFMWLPTGKELIIVRGAPSMEAAPEVTLWRTPLDGTPATEVARMRLPAFQGGFVGSLNYTMHPSGSRIAFERHAGMVSQYWAIDNLAQFIQSGAAVAVPPDPRSR